MSCNLLISVHLHEGRYHGTGEGRPSPARLFQALVAAAAQGRDVDDKWSAALKWLQGARPPVLGTPLMWPGQSVSTFVPNNDLDAVGGDTQRLAELRSSKSISPWLFDEKTPFLFCWRVTDTDFEYAQTICTLAERLYQFGRGVDMAWAWGEIVGDAEFEARLASYPGRVYHPACQGRGLTLACPQPGSLQSLKERYAGYARRFRVEGTGKEARRTFTQPPKARFAQIPYDIPSDRRVYELQQQSSPDTAIASVPLAHVATLVQRIRDLAVDRLQRHLPEHQVEVERALIGRKADGSNAGPTSARVRIMPLPSIGHIHADQRVRRIMVEVPAECPLAGDDVHWAFSGLDLHDPLTGVVSGIGLVRAGDDRMLTNFASTGPGQRVWRTVTPAVLPVAAARRRIDPSRRLAETKAGGERATEQARAACAVTQALRHAGIRGRIDSIRVQREPFSAHGERVEAFAPGTRFQKERIWHVEVTFAEPVPGPLMVGDGRFLGLGVMAPLVSVNGIFAFSIENGLLPGADPVDIGQALRRAVMARVQTVLSPKVPLPPFFTGHNRDGSPALGEKDPHISCAFDPRAGRLLVLAPHILERRSPFPREETYLRWLDEALTGLRQLRAGRAGMLQLQPCVVDSSDALLATSRCWESTTPYAVNRHGKHTTAGDSLVDDLVAECRRRGFPEPHVAPGDVRGVPGVGLRGTAHLTFPVAVAGPLLLGKTRHLGGGLFTAVRA